MNQRRAQATVHRNRSLRIGAVLVVAALGGVALLRLASSGEPAQPRSKAGAAPAVQEPAEGAARASYAVGDVLTYTLSHEAAVDMAEGGRFYHLAVAGEWMVRV